jgi:SAM-dependent methyltransferase
MSGRGGCAALALQARNHEVTALDISEYCVEAMARRGVERCVVGDIRTLGTGGYDTLLMLDSVLACAGTEEGIAELLSHLRSLLNEDGRVLIHDGILQTGLSSLEVMGHMEYGPYVGETFHWCSSSRQGLRQAATGAGWKVEYPYDDVEGRYIARLTAGG